MNSIICQSQQDVKALFYEAESRASLYNGDLIPKPSDKPHIIVLTEFTPSWARTELTTDEMLDWLDKHLHEWLFVANWTPSASANLSRVYSLLLRSE